MFGNGAYPGVGRPSPAVDPQVQQWFYTIDKDRSGQINWEELQAALVNGQGQNFSSAACKLMIGMFDTDHTGTIDVNEFQLLFGYINQWLSVFKNYDRDSSGSIEEAELAQAFQQMGFRFSPEFVKFLISKSDLKNHKQITVDQFIVTCIQIQRLQKPFEERIKR
ncbi:hypothetical protein NQ317_015272 [Molorchus minor]|uniref:EF-hand domain-containing protein n=1 Tax=Molorchus minor TaxID=1323400 RepID=A0ABQ9JAE9_9CUCU|nr:hypothetical protein NQ317_015272 [Molorchus minor]